MIDKDTVLELFSHPCFRCKCSDIANFPHELRCTNWLSESYGQKPERRCHYYAEWRLCVDCRYYHYDGFNAYCRNSKQGCVSYPNGMRHARFFEPWEDEQ